MTAPTPPAPRMVGRYALYKEIAAGGMATVHLGRIVGEGGFSRPVAIKRLHAHFAKDPAFVAMFLDEARLASRIFHPNVVAPLDVVSTDGELFLVMEYVRGASLSKLIRTVATAGKGIPVRIVVAIMSGVLHGLHAAHEARGDHNEALGIVHRDVSPQNVIVGIDGVARVLDFGVAKAAGRLQTTRDGQLKGKLAYMAPEQVRGEAVTRRTDIYAASVVLWETLTCRRLFKADNEAHALARVLSGNAAAPSSLVPDIPAELDAVVARGLHLDPQQRYATAREMASALEAVVQPAPTTDVAEWVEQCAAVDDAGDGAAEAATAQGSHSSWSMKAMRSLPAAMQQPLPTDEPPTRVAKLEEPRSGVSSVSVAHTPAPVLTKPRTKLAIVAAAGFVVFVGTVAVAFTMGRGSREAAPALSSGPPAATTTVTTQPAVSIAAPVVSAVPPPPMDSIPVVSVSALPKPQTQAPPPPHVVHTSAPTSDCNPPYTTDAKGHVHFKPQCM